MEKKEQTAMPFRAKLCCVFVPPGISFLSSEADNSYYVDLRRNIVIAGPLSCYGNYRTYSEVTNGIPLSNILNDCLLLCSSFLIVILHERGMANFVSNRTIDYWTKSEPPNSYTHTHDNNLTNISIIE
jgi:hypothetical protein